MNQIFADRNVVGNVDMIEKYRLAKIGTPVALAPDYKEPDRE